MDVAASSVLVVLAGNAISTQARRLLLFQAVPSCVYKRWTLEHAQVLSVDIIYRRWGREEIRGLLVRPNTRCCSSLRVYFVALREDEGMLCPTHTAEGFCEDAGDLNTRCSATRFYDLPLRSELRRCIRVAEAKRWWPLHCVFRFPVGRA